MLRVRQTNGSSQEPVAQAVVPQAAMGTVTTGAPKLLDQMRQALRSKHYSRRRNEYGEDVPRIRWNSLNSEMSMVSPEFITCQDKWLDQAQVIERKGFILPLTGSPKVSYTRNKANPFFLCGSI
ncbi:MAG: hypothetical protein A2Z25_03415 [Planctomycetes bacterium RBG_16_55_9]|nr:MAG: hypothetical protein A2Z25_03415 [Planctomycetes bacterium RBG_16_55_9]